MCLNGGAGEDCWESLVLQGDQSWIFIRRTVAEAEAPILGHLMQRAHSLEKNLSLVKIEGKGAYLLCAGFLDWDSQIVAWPAHLLGQGSACADFLFLTYPFQGCRSWIDAFVFCSTWLHGTLSCSFRCLGTKTILNSVQYSSLAQSCPTLCNPMDCRTPGFPVHPQLPELAQTHVHWVCDAIQPAHPLSSPSPPAFNLSQHQGIFQWVSSSHQVAKYWSFSFSISHSNEYSGLFPLGLTGWIS